MCHKTIRIERKKYQFKPVHSCTIDELSLAELANNMHLVGYTAMRNIHYLD